MRRMLIATSLALAVPALAAQEAPAWDTPRDAFHLLGNTWYVGTEAITVVLIRGPQGAVLIDTGVPASAASVLANIAAAGAAPSDIKLILTSHAHLDHVGAIAQLKQATGARVLASAASKELLEAGGKNDLHFADRLPYPPVVVDGVVGDGESVSVGDLRLTAHLTPAHTPGSTSWTWLEHEGGKAARMALVDSVTAPGYRLLGNERYPGIVEDFRKGFAAIRTLPCDVLLTPHPEASDLFARSAQGRLVDPATCKAYADRGEAGLDAQLAEQRAAARK
jgi:metallo-beta-lactamase class B